MIIYLDKDLMPTSYLVLILYSFYRMVLALKVAAREEGLDYTTLSADANKDCHYSWHVHVIFSKLIPLYGWTIYVLTEALYCLSLTPSSIGWREGIW